MKISPTFRVGIGLSCGCFVLGLGYGFWTRPIERVVFLSVGQGDCTLVQSEGRVALIDVGPAIERVDLVTHLRKLGVNHVDEVLLSHPDADHVGGLAEIEKAWPLVEVYSPSCFSVDQKMIQVMNSAQVSVGHRHWVGAEAGEIGRFQVQIRCHAWSSGEDDNLGSMFVKLSDGDATLVTTGDGPAQEELDELPLADWHAEILHWHLYIWRNT